MDSPPGLHYDPFASQQRPTPRRQEDQDGLPTNAGPLLGEDGRPIINFLAAPQQPGHWSQYQTLSRLTEEQYRQRLKEEYLVDSAQAMLKELKPLHEAIVRSQDIPLLANVHDALVEEREQLRTKEVFVRRTVRHAEEAVVEMESEEWRLRTNEFGLPVLAPASPTTTLSDPSDDERARQPLPYDPAGQDKRPMIAPEHWHQYRVTSSANMGRFWASLEKWRPLLYREQRVQRRDQLEYAGVIYAAALANDPDVLYQKVADICKNQRKLVPPREGWPTKLETFVRLATSSIGILATPEEQRDSLCHRVPHIPVTHNSSYLQYAHEFVMGIGTLHHEGDARAYWNNFLTFLGGTVYKKLQEIRHLPLGCSGGGICERISRIALNASQHGCVDMAVWAYWLARLTADSATLTNKDYGEFKNIPFADLGRIEGTYTFGSEERRRRIRVMYLSRTQYRETCERHKAKTLKPLHQYTTGELDDLWRWLAEPDRRCQTAFITTIERQLASGELSTARLVLTSLFDRRALHNLHRLGKDQIQLLQGALAYYEGNLSFETRCRRLQVLAYIAPTIQQAMISWVEWRWACGNMDPRNNFRYVSSLLRWATEDQVRSLERRVPELVPVSWGVHIRSIREVDRGAGTGGSGLWEMLPLEKAHPPESWTHKSQDFNVKKRRWMRQVLLMAILTDDGMKALPNTLKLVLPDSVAVTGGFLSFLKGSDLMTLVGLMRAGVMGRPPWLEPEGWEDDETLEAMETNRQDWLRISLTTERDLKHDEQ